MLGYGVSNPVASFPAPELLPHTISLRLEGSRESSRGDPSGALAGTVAFVIKGSTITVQALRGSNSSFEHDVDIDFLVRLCSLGYRV